MEHTVIYSPVALKNLARMPRNIATRIEDKIEEAAANPAQARNFRALVNTSPSHRLRVGDWRVLVDLRPGNPPVFYIHNVLPRSKAYR